MWYNNNNTGGDKVNQNTHRNLEKGRWGGGSQARAGGKQGGEPTQVYLSAPHNTEKRNLQVCGGLKTSPFLTYCEQLLLRDKTSWSFLQEISKCLCLELSGCNNPQQSQKGPQEPQSAGLLLQRNFWKPRPQPQRGQAREGEEATAF